MDPSAVIIRYSPSRWTELQASDNTGSPSKMVTFNYGKSGFADHNTESRPTHLQQMPRKRHLIPLSDSSFERPVAESLQNLSEYANIMKLGTKPVKTIEEDWYHDLTNVGQRLKFLRDTFKVIQSARKRKMMGQRADFRTLYDAKVSRTGSPLLSDDERNASDEDTPKTVLSAVPALNAPRRGRPRKYRGRVKKATLSRADVAVKRTRASRRIQETPSSPSGSKNGASSATPDPSNVSPTQIPPPKRRGRWANRKTTEAETSPPSPTSEPQGPPLTHSPPILPSQRLPVVPNVPPYKQLGTNGAQPLPAYSTVSYKESTPVQENTTGVQSKVQPFLPSQVPYHIAPYTGNGPGASAYLPSQVQPSGSYAYSKYPPVSKPAVSTPAYPVGVGSSGYPAYGSATPTVQQSSYPSTQGEPWTPKPLGPTGSGKNASEDKTPRFHSLVSKPQMPVSGISQGQSFPRIGSTNTSMAPYGSWPSSYPESVQSQHMPSRQAIHSPSILHSSSNPPTSNPNISYVGHTPQPYQQLTVPLSKKPEFEAGNQVVQSTQLPHKTSLPNPNRVALGPQDSQNHLTGRAPETTRRTPSQLEQPIRLSQIAPELRPESMDSLGMALPSLQALENEIQSHEPAGSK